MIPTCIWGSIILFWTLLLFTRWFTDFGVNNVDVRVKSVKYEKIVSEFEDRINKSNSGQIDWGK